MTEPAAIHLRSRQYIVLLLFAAAIGIVAALTTLGFLYAEHGLQELLWHDLPDALDIDADGWLFTLAVTTIGGLAVGLVIRFMPGHGGPGPAEGHGFGETGIPMQTVPGLVLAALLSLAVGASLGPEAPLLALAAAIGPWIATRMGRETLGKLLTMAGIGSIFSLLFGSPLAAAFIGLEVTAITGHNLYVFLIPVLVASTAGFFGFRILTESSLDSLATLDFPSYTNMDPGHLLAALLIGAAGALVGLLVIATFRVVDRTLRPLDHSPVAKAALGGLGIGLVAVLISDLTLFSGESSLEDLLADPDQADVWGLPVGWSLLLIVGGKIASLCISLATGFRGGRIFPGVFIGGTLGILVNQIYGGVPLAVAAAAGMAGATVAILRLPVFSILFISFFCGPLLVPLIILAVVIAYVLVFDKPELGGDPPEEQTTAAPADVGERAT